MPYLLNRLESKSDEYSFLKQTQPICYFLLLPIKKKFPGSPLMYIPKQELKYLTMECVFYKSKYLYVYKDY